MCFQQLLSESIICNLHCIQMSKCDGWTDSTSSSKNHLFMMNGGSGKGLGVLNCGFNTSDVRCLVTDFNFSLRLRTKPKTYLTQFSTQRGRKYVSRFTSCAQTGF